MDSETGNGEIRIAIMIETQQIYAVPTSKLTGWMELLPENKSSELSHPDWRGPFLVDGKPLQEGNWKNE